MPLQSCIVPGRPLRQLKCIANLREWFTELAADFDRALPICYRYTGEPPTGDKRADAWAAADRCIVTTAAALSDLESVLRTQTMLRAKPRGKGKTKEEAEVAEPASSAPRS